jgi:hypothetical protein
VADKKISQLTAATTPLAGSEVLPIVQSSTTVKVSVTDVTKGRTIQTTGINDNNNNEVITITTTASAVNEITVANAATGANPVISATGSDTNIGITLTPKGTGNAILTSGNLVPNTAATGINFTANTPAAGMTSQLLNWYEEGTWTPTDASGAGLSLTVTSARYTRIGQQVTAQFDITFPSTADTSAQILGGLPFVPANQSYGGFVTYTNHANALNFLVYSSGGVGYVSFRQAAGGSNNTNAAYSTDVIRGVLVYFV